MKYLNAVVSFVLTFVAAFLWRLFITPIKAWTVARWTAHAVNCPECQAKLKARMRARNAD